MNQKNKPESKPWPGSADQLVYQIRDLLAELWELPLPEAERRKRMQAVKALIEVHYLKEDSP